MKIVVVDDEPKIRNGLEKLLNRYDGIEVVSTFADAESAFLYLSDHSADVLITDIKMPGDTGLQLIRKIKNFCPELHCAILSGYGHFNFAQEAIKLGVERFFLKPTNPNELIEYLDSLRADCSLLQQPSEISSKMDLLEVGIPVNINTVSSENTHNQIVEETKRYIRSHYSQKLRLVDLASELRISPNYLCELFKRHTGCNLKEYITQYKLKKSCELLANVTYQIADVASKVGYSSPKYFSAAFKKQFGITPFEYRNQIAPRCSKEDEP